MANPSCPAPYVLVLSVALPAMPGGPLDDCRAGLFSPEKANREIRRDNFEAELKKLEQEISNQD